MSSDNHLALPKGRASSDDPMALPKGRYKGRESNDYPLSLPLGRVMGGQAMMTPWLIQKKKAMERVSREDPLALPKRNN